MKYSDLICFTIEGPRVDVTDNLRFRGFPALGEATRPAAKARLGRFHVQKGRSECLIEVLCRTTIVIQQRIMESQL